MALVNDRELNLIVVDSALQDMDGYAFIRKLRRCGVTPNCWAPVILVTAQKAPAGGGLTAQEFELMRERAYADPKSVTPAAGESFKGFLEIPAPSTAFSFLVEGGGPAPASHPQR